MGLSCGRGEPDAHEFNALVAGTALSELVKAAADRPDIVPIVEDMQG